MPSCAGARTAARSRVKRIMRTLLFSTLYPSSARPTHGIFVETRLRELLRQPNVETRVVAPVPWFWSTDPKHGEYAAMARTPAREAWNGIDVQHPRYIVIPKVGMTAAPLLLALGARAAVQRVLDEGFDFDLIDAHYYYPDGVAAALLSRWFGKPFVVTARGTDLNLIPAYAAPAAMIRWAARRASASIGVCAALLEPLREWQIEEERLTVLRNGVDLQRFFPQEPSAARSELGVSGEPVLISVGHLIERKGHHLVIEALADLRSTHPRASLLIVGEGPERASLVAHAQRLGVSEQVRLVGAVPNATLAGWYSAADVLVLASSREGWANVLLESMACGTPVVATDIWGTPEVVQPESGGVLVAHRSGKALAQGLRLLLAAQVDRLKVRRYAEGFGWQQTSVGQCELFAKVKERHKHA
ncbi:glycosyl transferase family 1 [beta proteobacterium AAP51]|nr:glycosyl transferase family 1 [beta proteobacterium AAP51]